jgi:hypothetical protein
MLQTAGYLDFYVEKNMTVKKGEKTVKKGERGGRSGTGSRCRRKGKEKRGGIGSFKKIIINTLSNNFLMDF